MRVLIATQDYFPTRGGLQASVDTLVQGLITHGHVCAVLIKTTRRDMRNFMGLAKRVARKLFKSPIIVSDRTFPYPAYRTPLPRESLTTVRRIFKPDIMVCVVGGSYTTQFAKDVLNAAGDLPTLTYIFDIEGVTLTTDQFCARTHVVANAEAIASLVANHRKRPPVVPCIVEPTDCQVESTREIVLYINPYPRKGVNLAWAIAEAAPGLNFVFQESWLLKDEQRLEIIEHAQRLGNVEFRAVTDQPEEVYRDARVLLAPYGSERPRVVDEAQANGIPVVASAVPGLDECVGTGGVLIDPHGDIGEWVSALERINSDKEYYEGLVTAAIRHSKRQEIQPDYLIKLFERELQFVIKGSYV